MASGDTTAELRSLEKLLEHSVDASPRLLSGLFVVTHACVLCMLRSADIMTCPVLNPTQSTANTGAMLTEELGVVEGSEEEGSVGVATGATLRMRTLLARAGCIRSGNNNPMSGASEKVLVAVMHGGVLCALCMLCEARASVEEIVKRRS